MARTKKTKVGARSQHRGGLSSPGTRGPGQGTTTAGGPHTNPPGTPPQPSQSETSSEMQIKREPAAEISIKSEKLHQMQIKREPADEMQITRAPADEMQITREQTEEKQINTEPAAEIPIKSETLDEMQITRAPADEMQIMREQADEMQITREPADEMQTERTDGHSRKRKRPAVDMDDDGDDQDGEDSEKLETDTSEVKELTCKLNLMIKNRVTAMVGLRFITELYTMGQPDTPPTYTCSLCGCNCGIEYIIAHITGLQHRTKFLEKFHKGEFEQIGDITNLAERRRQVEHQAKLIEVDLGREEISVQLLPNPATGDADMEDAWLSDDGKHAVPSRASEPDDKLTRKKLKGFTETRRETTVTANINHPGSSQVLLGKDKNPINRPSDSSLSGPPTLRGEDGSHIASTRPSAAVVPALDIADFALLHDFETAMFPTIQHFHDRNVRLNCPYLCGQCGYRGHNNKSMREHMWHANHSHAHRFTNSELFLLGERSIIRKRFRCSLCGFYGNSSKQVDKHKYFIRGHDMTVPVLVDGFLMTANYKDAVDTLYRRKREKDGVGFGPGLISGSPHSRRADVEHTEQGTHPAAEVAASGCSKGNRSRMETKLDDVDLALLHDFEASVFSQIPYRNYNNNVPVESPCLCGQCGYRGKNFQAIILHKKASKHFNACVFWNSELFCLGKSGLRGKRYGYTCSLCGFAMPELEPVMSHMSNAAAHGPTIPILVGGFLFTLNHEDAVGRLYRGKMDRQKPVSVETEVTGEIPGPNNGGDEGDHNKLDKEDLVLITAFELEVFSLSPHITNDPDFRRDNPYLCGQCGFRDRSYELVVKHRQGTGHVHANVYSNVDLFSLGTKRKKSKRFICSWCGTTKRDVKPLQEHIKQQPDHIADTPLLICGFLHNHMYQAAVHRLLFKKLEKDGHPKENNEPLSTPETIPVAGPSNDSQNDVALHRNKALYKRIKRRDTQLELRVKMYVCAFCGFELKTISDAEAHKQDKGHKDAKIVSWEHTLAEAEKIRLETKRYSCSVCIFSSNCSNIVRRHFEDATTFHKLHMAMGKVMESSGAELATRVNCNSDQVERELTEKDVADDTDKSERARPDNDTDCEVDGGDNRDISNGTQDTVPRNLAVTRNTIDVVAVRTTVGDRDDQAILVKEPQKPVYWICTSCGHICPDSPSSRSRHFALMHSDWAPYTCSTCWLRATDEKSVIFHQKSDCHSGGSVIKQSGAFPLTFGPQADFVRLSESSVLSQECEVCSCGFTTMVPSVMSNHTSKADGEHRDVGRKKLSQFDDLRQMVNDWNTTTSVPAADVTAMKQYRPLQWQCQRCSQVKRAEFHSGQDLDHLTPLQFWPIKHFLLHHSTEPPYFCGVCGFKAVTRERVRKHIDHWNHGSEFDIVAGETIQLPRFTTIHADISLTFCDDVNEDTMADKRPTEACDGAGVAVSGFEDEDLCLEDNVFGEVHGPPVSPGGGADEDYTSLNYILKFHLKAYGEPPPGHLWRCTMCGMCAANYRLATIHYQHYHCTSPPYRCGQCDFPGHRLLYIDQHLSGTGHSGDNLRSAKNPGHPMFIGKQRDFVPVKAELVPMATRGEQHTPCVPGSVSAHRGENRSMYWHCLICGERQSILYPVQGREIRKMLQYPFIHHRRHTGESGDAQGGNHHLLSDEPVLDGPSPDYVFYSRGMAKSDVDTKEGDDIKQQATFSEDVAVIESDTVPSENSDP